MTQGGSTRRRLTRRLQRLSLEDRELLAEVISRRVMELEFPPIMKLELFLTEDCNLRCDYCFVSPRPKRMTPETVKAALDFLIQQSRDQTQLSVTLFGGEPLMEWPVLKATVEYAEQAAAKAGKKIGWACTTNGVLLDQEMMTFAHQHGFLYFLSIDGDRETHDLHRRTVEGAGSFDAIMEKLPLLKRYQGWLGARVTCTSKTLPRLAQNIQFLFYHGINQFIFSPACWQPWSRSDATEYRRQLAEIADFYLACKKRNLPIRMTSFESPLEEMAENTAPLWGCHAGRTCLSVAADGSLYPCSMFVGQPFGEEWRLGSLEEGITRRDLCRRLMDSREEVRFKCSRCKYKHYCAGGCPADNLQQWSTPYHPNRLACTSTSALIDLLSQRPELPLASRPPEATQFPECEGPSPGAEVSEVQHITPLVPF